MSNGLPRCFTDSYNSIAMEKLFPSNIHSAAHALDRELLFYLATMPTKSDDIQHACQQGLKFIQATLTIDDTYRDFAEATVMATLCTDADNAILHCNNFAEPVPPTYSNTAEQALPLVASCVKDLYKNPDSSEKQQEKSKQLLLNFDDLYGKLQGPYSGQCAHNQLQCMIQMMQPYHSASSGSLSPIDLLDSVSKKAAFVEYQAALLRQDFVAAYKIPLQDLGPVEFLKT